MQKLPLPFPNLVRMELVAFADSGQGVLFFEDFQFELSGELALGPACHTGLKLARYPT